MPPPKALSPQAERQRREEAKQAKERQAAEERRRKQEEDARERAERKAIIDAFWEALTPEQQAELEAAAIAQADAEELKPIEPGR